MKEQNDSNKNAGASSKKKKKTKGYIQPKVEDEEQAVGWEGFVETLSKMQASQLSKLLKNKGKIESKSDSERQLEEEKPKTEQKNEIVTKRKLKMRKKNIRN